MQYPTTSLTLLDKIVNGDEIGWNEFYLRYQPVVLAVAKYRGLDAAAAEDVLQQVMLSFFQQSKNFRFDPKIARFRTYFGSIVNARIADYYRKRNDIPCAEIQSDDTYTPDYDDVFLSEFRKAVLDDICQQLKQRVSVTTWQAFELYTLQKRPVEKVAAFLKCSVNQIYQAKKRCMTILRELVAAANQNDPELKLELFFND